MTLNDNDVRAGDVLVLTTVEPPVAEWVDYDPCHTIAAAGTAVAPLARILPAICCVLLGGFGAVALVLPATHADTDRPFHRHVSGSRCSSWGGRRSARSRRPADMCTPEPGRSALRGGHRLSERTAGLARLRPAARIRGHVLRGDSPIARDRLRQNLFDSTGDRLRGSGSHLDRRCDVEPAMNASGAALVSVSFATLAFAPRLSMVLSGTAPDAAPNVELCHRILTGLVVGSSIGAALGATSVAIGEIRDTGSALRATAFAAIVALVLLLRVRAHIDPTRRIGLAAAAVLTGAAGFAAAVISYPASACCQRTRCHRGCCGTGLRGQADGKPNRAARCRGRRVSRSRCSRSIGLLGRRNLRMGSGNEPDMTTIVRLVGASALAVMPLWTAPAAVAVTPPVVDMSILPKPGSPAPPQRTEQQGQCVVPTDGTIESTVNDLLGLEDVWPLSRGAGQTVAVIDTGVTRHRLLPHLVPGGDYVSSGDGTADCDGHGTIVAGIIGAPRTRTSFSGIAPDATIMGIRQSSNRFRASTIRRLGFRRRRDPGDGGAHRGRHGSDGDQRVLGRVPADGGGIG